MGPERATAGTDGIVTAATPATVLSPPDATSSPSAAPTASDEPSAAAAATTAPDIPLRVDGRGGVASSPIPTLVAAGLIAAVGTSAVVVARRRRDPAA